MYNPYDDFPAWIEAEMMEDEDTGITVSEHTGPVLTVETIDDLPW